MAASEQAERRQRKRERQRQSLKAASSHNPREGLRASGQPVGPQSIDAQVPPYPCRTRDEFYDNVTGMCGMCEDICRPQHMDMIECQAKCSMYYREKIIGDASMAVKTTLAATASLLFPTSSYRTSRPSVVDSPKAEPVLGSTHLVPQGGAQDDNLPFYAVMTITMVISLTVMTVVVVVFLLFKRNDHKRRHMASASISEGVPHLTSQSCITSSSSSNPDHIIAPGLDRQASNEKQSNSTLLVQPQKPGYYQPGPSATSPPPSYDRAQSTDDKGMARAQSEHGDRARASSGQDERASSGHGENSVRIDTTDWESNNAFP